MLLDNPTVPPEYLTLLPSIIHTLDKGVEKDRRTKLGHAEAVPHIVTVRRWLRQYSGPFSCAKVADSVGIDRPTIYHALQRLVKGGNIVRIGSPDNCVKLYRLTPKGEKRL